MFRDTTMFPKIAKIVILVEVDQVGPLCESDEAKTTLPQAGENPDFWEKKIQLKILKLESTIG